jgi:hypothetical protein
MQAVTATANHQRAVTTFGVAEDGWIVLARCGVTTGYRDNQDEFTFPIPFHANQAHTPASNS